MTDRDDMTAHDRDETVAASSTEDRTATEVPAPAGSEAPVVPSSTNAQQPEGATPPGGPAQGPADLIADQSVQEDIGANQYRDKQDAPTDED